MNRRGFLKKCCGLIPFVGGLSIVAQSEPVKSKIIGILQCRPATKQVPKYDFINGRLVIRTATVVDKTEAVKEVEKILAPGDRLTPKAIEFINYPVHKFNRWFYIDKFQMFAKI